VIISHYQNGLVFGATCALALVRAVYFQLKEDLHMSTLPMKQAQQEFCGDHRHPGSNTPRATTHFIPIVNSCSPENFYPIRKISHIGDSVKITDAKFKVHKFAMNCPNLDQQRVFKQFRDRLNTETAGLIFDELLGHFKATIFEMEPAQRQAALDCLTAVCALACDIPIQLPDQPETLAELPHQTFNPIRKKQRRYPYNFIDDGFCQHPPEKEEARRLACLLKLLSFDDPLPALSAEDDAWAECRKCHNLDTCPSHALGEN
jgi:hypothetical protein